MYHFLKNRSHLSEKSIFPLENQKQSYNIDFRVTRCTLLFKLITMKKATKLKTVDQERVERLRKYRREYYRKYRNEHRELIKAINKKYVKRHKAQIAEYKKQWLRKKKEKLIAEGKLIPKRPRKEKPEMVSKKETSIGKRWATKKQAK
jgi:hypothetical protein